MVVDFRIEVLRIGLGVIVVPSFSVTTYVEVSVVSPAGRVIVAVSLSMMILVT